MKLHGTSTAKVIALAWFVLSFCRATEGTAQGISLLDSLGAAGLHVVDAKGSGAPSVSSTEGPVSERFGYFAQDIEANLEPGTLEVIPATGITLWWEGSVTVALGPNQIAFATSDLVAITARASCPKDVHNVYVVAIGARGAGGVSADARNFGKNGVAEAVGGDASVGDQAGGNATAEAEQNADATGGQGSGNKKGGNGTALSAKAVARARGGIGTGTDLDVGGDGGSALATASKGDAAYANGGKGAPGYFRGGSGGKSTAVAPHGAADADGGIGGEGKLQGGLGGIAQASGREATATGGIGGKATFLNSSGGDGGHAEALATQRATARAGNGGDANLTFGFGGDGGNATTCGKPQTAVAGEPGHAFFDGDPGVVEKC